MDKDLKFLRNADSCDLKILCDYFKTKNSESLSKTNEYKKNYPNSLQKIADKIVSELQLFGGDSIVNFFRGNGVSYREIVIDVCKKLDVQIERDNTVEGLEDCLIKKILLDHLIKMSDEEKRKLCDDIELYVKYQTDSELCDAMLKYKVLSAYAFVSSSFVSNILGVVSAVAAFAMGRCAGFALGPIALAVGILSIITCFSGPAYSVTVPCVVHIAYMRKKSSFKNSHTAKITKKCAITLLGISQAGKTLFKHTLMSLNPQYSSWKYKDERTVGVATLEPFEFFIDDDTLIKIETGSDIGGNLENTDIYDEYVNKDRVVIFFFDAEQYLNNERYYNLTNKQLDIFYKIKDSAELEMSYLHVVASHRDKLINMTSEEAKLMLKNKLHDYRWDYPKKLMINLYLVNMMSPNDVKKDVIKPIFSTL